MAEVCFMQIKSPSPSHHPTEVSPEKPQGPIEMHTWQISFAKSPGHMDLREPLF